MSGRFEPTGEQRQLLDTLEQRAAAREQRFHERLDTLERKIESWEARIETGSLIVRWGFIAIAGFMTGLASVYEWAKDHLR